MIEVDTIHCGNCLDFMANLPENSIDLTVTSPPYDNLRDYKGYSFDYQKIADELFRVTKAGGVVVWVVGDSVKNFNKSLTSFRQAIYFQEIGFNVYDNIIYERAHTSLPNPYRYFNGYEYMFVFSKGKPKTIHLIKDRKNEWGGTGTFGKTRIRQKDGSMKYRCDKRVIHEYSVRRNIWRYSNAYMIGTRDKFAFEHPAIFPEKLAQDHIISWSNEGDIVFDPMCGSGTTLKMAKLNNRHYIGCDISEEYVEIAKKRVGSVT